MKETVEVVASVIKKNNLILCTRRPTSKKFPGYWEFPGGKVEDGETKEEALIREIKEESNMKVLKYWPIGYQEVVDEGVYQLRYACIVEPYGSFEKDPDAGEGYGVDKICTVDPEEFTKYVQWGKIGKRLIERAQEIVAKNR